MIAFSIILFILLTLIAIWDYETEEIPHTLTIATLIMGITSLIIFAENWLVPFILGILVFVVYAILFFTTNKIGGGDVKILAISFLLLHNNDMILTYCITFVASLMVGLLITFSKNKSSLRLGPYMSFGLIGTYIYHLTNDLEIVLYCACVFILIIKLIDYSFFYKRRVILNEELFKIIKE